MRYLSNTGPEQRAMLDVIGATSIEALLARVPVTARLARPLDLPAAAAEMDLVREMRTLAAMNADAESYACFLGAGSPVSRWRIVRSRATATPSSRAAGASAR